MSASELTSGIKDIADLARETLDGGAAPDVDARGRERFIDAVDRSALKRRSRALFVSLAAACLMLGVLLVAFWPSSKLTFDVRGGQVVRSEAGGAQISALEDESVARFSDGSTVTFGPGSSGRIDDVGARGARVVVAAGRVHLDIAHRAGTTWSVEAGPHVVRVTGTEFDVDWDPVKGAFSVVMLRGSVRAEGPSSPSGVTLEAGYALEASRDGEVRITRVDAMAAAPSHEERVPEAQVVAAPPSAPQLPPTSPVEVSSLPAVTAAPKPASKSWSELVSDGKYGEVVRAARERGLDSVASSASLADLIALGDAARYEKDSAAARATLEAERKRFGSTQAGRTATFLLGRLAEDSDEDIGRAIALYDEYLGGGGPFAAEALGRKMVAVKRTKGDAAARPIASAYLEKYPQGGYAKVATAIVEAK